jgi:hypothetical protein
MDNNISHKPATDLNTNLHMKTNISHKLVTNLNTNLHGDRYQSQAGNRLKYKFAHQDQYQP